MRRKGIFMAVLMVVLGISAFMAIQQNRHEQQDIAAINMKEKVLSSFHTATTKNDCDD